MANLIEDARVSPVAVAAAGALSLAVAMGIGRFAFTPLLPLMIQEGQLDVAVAGWLASANYAGYFLGAVTASRMPCSAGRLGLAALVLTAALTAAMAVPGSLPLWLVLRLAAGIASAWAFVGTSVWCLGALAQRGRLGWGVAVYAGVGAGIAVAGLYCLAGGARGVNAAHLWWQLGLLAAGLTLPVAVVLRGLHPGPAPRATAASGAPAPTPTPTPTPKGSTALVLCYGAFGFGYILPATFLPVLARSVVEDPRLFGLAWPVFGAMAALSTFVAGWFLRHASRLRVLAAAHVLMGIGVLLPSLRPNGLTIGLSALLVGGTFMVITMTGVQEIRARAKGDPTAQVGRMTAAFALGQIAGPIFSSLLLRPGWAGADGLNRALQAAAAVLLLSAASLWQQSRSPLTSEDPPHAH